MLIDPYRFAIDTAPEADVYFSYVTSLMHFNGIDGSTTFTDVIPSAVGQPARVWTGNGNAQLDADVKKFGTASLLLDGSGDFLTTPATPNLDLTSGKQFTIECWIRVPVLTDGTILYKRKESAEDGGFEFGITSAGAVYFSGANGASLGTVTTANGLITTDVWQLVAVTNKAGTIRIFVDGVLQKTSALTFTSSINQQLKLGVAAAGVNFFNGWIDALRISKNVARYVATYTPLTTPFSDQLLEYVATILHFDGADGSTSFPDATGHATWTPTGNTQVDTAQSKFGGASGAFDGTGDWLQSDQVFALQGAFTVEGFARWSVAPSSAKSLFYFIDNETAIEHGVYGSVNHWRVWTGTFNDTGVDIVTDTWYHFALVYEDGIGLKLYVDGVEIYFNATSIGDFSPTAIRLGAYLDGSDALIGFLDEVRVSNFRQYTANFTPPAAPFS